jgi:hypothetical protein
VLVICSLVIILPPLLTSSIHTVPACVSVKELAHAENSYLAPLLPAIVCLLECAMIALYYRLHGFNRRVYAKYDNGELG